MSQRFREKLALVVFAIAVAAFFFCVISYLIYGHSWTNAARDIDETRGVMDGYTIILYEGTQDPVELQKHKQSLQDKKAAADGEEGSHETGEKDYGASEMSGQDSEAGEAAGAIEAACSEEASLASDGAGSDPVSTESASDGAGSDPVSTESASDGASAEFASDSESAQSASDDSATASDAEAAGSEQAQGENPAGEESAEKSSVDDASDAEEMVESVSIDDLKEVYRSKGASVICLDSFNPGYYEGDDIFLGTDTRRVGVFYAPVGSTVTQMIEQVDFFAEHSVDVLVCLADNSSFVHNDPLGIDAVLSLGYETEIENGAIENGTLYCTSPLEGQVGAIIISPEGVLSTKVITHAQSVEELEEPSAEVTE